VALLLEQLRGTDSVAVSAALWVAQNDVPGTAASAALAAGLPTLPEHRQVALTQALGSRADPAAVAALPVLARCGGKAVRLAAVQGMPRRRGAAAVLVDLLEDPDADVAAAAQSALAEWPDPAPDSALVARLDVATGTQRLAAIQLVGARGLPAAAPGLLRLARDPDPAARLAALRVLADLAGADDLPALLELLPAGAAPEEREALERALRTACGKAANPAACAGMLVRLLPKAEPGVTETLLRLLHGLGGEPACLAVLAATGDGNADLSALAYRLLAEWRTPEAVPHLLRLAGTSPQPTATLLCLRGCIRLAGSPETPVAQKFDLCRRLVPLAQREEEKKLLLGVLAGLPGPEALALTRPYLDEPATRAEAGAALLAIAEPLLSSPAAAPAKEALQALARSAAGTDQARRAEALLAKGAGSPAGN
jgi:HEAT repeat protein